MAKLINKYSSLENKIPVADGMSAGEIAVNFHENKEFLSIKNSASGISTFDRTTTYGKSGATAVNYDSLRLKGSSSATDSLEKGTNSATLGQELQTENAGEVAVGRYNKSTSGQTVFSVGAGTGAGASRSNVLEVTTGKVIADSIETREGIAYATMDIVEDNEYVTAQALNLLNTNINDLSAMTEDFVTKTDYATDVNAGIVRVGGSGLTMSAGKVVANVDGSTIQINGNGQLVAIGGGGGGSVTAGSGISVNAGTVAVKPDTSVGFGFNGSSALTLNSVNVGGDIKTTGGTVSGVTVMGGSIVSTGNVSATGDITTTAGTVKGETVSGATVKGDNGQFTSLSASSISDGSSNSYVKTNSYASSSTAGVVKIGEGLSVSDGVISVSGIPSGATIGNINASGNVTVSGANSQIIASGTNAVISGTSVQGDTVSGTTVKGDTGQFNSLSDGSGHSYLTSEDLPLATSGTAGVVKVSGGSGLEMVSGSNSGITDQLKVKVDGTTIKINDSGKLEAIGGGGGLPIKGGTLENITKETRTGTTLAFHNHTESADTHDEWDHYTMFKLDSNDGTSTFNMNFGYVPTSTSDTTHADSGTTFTMTTTDPIDRSRKLSYLHASVYKEPTGSYKSLLNLNADKVTANGNLYNGNYKYVSLSRNPNEGGYPVLFNDIVSGHQIYATSELSLGYTGKTEYKINKIDMTASDGMHKMYHEYYDKNLQFLKQSDDMILDGNGMTISAVSYTDDTSEAAGSTFLMTIASHDAGFPYSKGMHMSSYTQVRTATTYTDSWSLDIQRKIALAADGHMCWYTSTGQSPQSDSRLKQNIEDINESDIDNIKKVRLKRYQWNNSDIIHYGAIAQDVESAGLTDMVEDDDNGYKHLSYQDLLVLKIAYLERELEKLTEKIERLEEKVS